MMTVMVVSFVAAAFAAAAIHFSGPSEAALAALEVAK